MMMKRKILSLLCRVVPNGKRDHGQVAAQLGLVRAMLPPKIDKALDARGELVRVAGLHPPTDSSRPYFNLRASLSGGFCAAASDCPAAAHALSASESGGKGTLALQSRELAIAKRP